MRPLKKKNVFKINNRNTKNMYETCSKLTIKSSEPDTIALIVSCEHIFHLLLVFLLLAFNR